MKHNKKSLYKQNIKREQKRQCEKKGILKETQSKKNKTRQPNDC